MAVSAAGQSFISFLLMLITVWRFFRFRLRPVRWLVLMAALASVANAPLSVRAGRPGLLLRGLCLPAERADDEPLLPLRLLSQVIVLLLLRERRMSGG